MAYFSLPFTSFTFTVAVVVSEEVLTVEAGYLFPGLDVPQHFDTSCVSSRRHKLCTQTYKQSHFHITYEKSVEL